MKALLLVVAAAALGIVAYHTVLGADGRSAVASALSALAPGEAEQGGEGARTAAADSGEGRGASAGSGSAGDPLTNGREIPASLAERFRAEDREAEAASRTVYYQYVDADGTVHFVDTLEHVPPAQRDRAGRIELENRPPASGGGDAPPARLASSSPPPFAYDPDTEPVRRRGPEVVVYTTSWCGWCRKTLAWLDERGVDYVNKDIEVDNGYRRELIEKTGRSSIPMVEIDGERIRGFDPDRMAALLGS